MRKSRCVFKWWNRGQSPGGWVWFGVSERKIFFPTPYHLSKAVSKLCSHKAGGWAGGSKGWASECPSSSHPLLREQGGSVCALGSKSTDLQDLLSISGSVQLPLSQLAPKSLLSYSQCPAAQQQGSGWAWPDLSGPSANPSHPSSKLRTQVSPLHWFSSSVRTRRLNQTIGHVL